MRVTQMGKPQLCVCLCITPCACVCVCQFPLLTKGEKQPGRVYQRGTLLQNILDEAKVVFIRCINIHDEW